MKYYKKLVGDSLYLSPMSKEDVSKYVEWMSDFKITDGIGRSCNITTLEGEIGWIDKVNSKSNEFNFAIIDLKTDKLLGNCSIVDIDNVRKIATIGIFIGDEENRNKGKGSEALNLLLDFSFNYLNLNNLMLGVFSFNDRALKCYEKVGFKQIGARRNSYYLNGKYYDTIFMDILKEEFTGNYIRNKNI